jgi:predicted deacylase
MMDISKIFGVYEKEITLVSLPEKDRNVRIPVADIRGRTSGKTLLVTGGIDGDEYAGIEAAYRLIKKYSHTDLYGRLIIVPIVNPFGYLAEQSKNPIDDKFPKYELPGDPQGSSSQRLGYWLVSRYASEAHLWLNLHSGALTERVRPHIWVRHTGVKEVDARTKKFIEVAQTPVVQRKATRGSVAEFLAKKDCSYVLLESGGRGECASEDVERHVRWVENAMGLLGIHDVEHRGPALQREVRVYNSYSTVCAPCDGVYTFKLLKNEVTKGEDVGSYRTFTGKEVALTAPCNGIVLWQKETMAMRTGDVLCAIAH